MLKLAVILLFSILLLVLSISRWKVHPFLALIGCSLLLALTTGFPLNEIPPLVNRSFSSTFCDIGLIIIFGAMLGGMLECSGAAISLADGIVRLVGKRHPDWAMMLMGWIISIPIFCDTAFILLNPVRKSLNERTSCNPLKMSLVLASGLFVSHLLIPPTPGPIAAAGSLGISNDLLPLILWGAVISIPCLLVAYLYSHFYCRRHGAEASTDTGHQPEVSEMYDVTYARLIESRQGRPGFVLSLMPILLPILCMASGSILKNCAVSGWSMQFITFIGHPVIALMLGFLSALLLLVRSNAMHKLGQLTEESLKVAGPILFITAAGSTFGQIMVDAGLVDVIKAAFRHPETMGLLLPFFICLLLKTAQGSSTVAMTTTAGIMGCYCDGTSLMQAIGLDTPMSAVWCVLAIGCGSMIVTHANASYFWVVCKFGEIPPETAYRSFTVITGLMGAVGMAAVLLLSGLV